jgi:hypothetical protein
MVIFTTATAAAVTTTTTTTPTTTTTTAATTTTNNNNVSYALLLSQALSLHDIYGILKETQNFSDCYSCNYRCLLGYIS